MPARTEIYAADSDAHDAVNDALNTIFSDPAEAEGMITILDGALSCYWCGVQMTSAQYNAFGAAIEDIQGIWRDYFGATYALRQTLIDSTINQAAQGKPVGFLNRWREGLGQAVLYNAPTITVENLNDSGAGSFRAALDTVGPRKIRNNAGVGYIDQESELLFTSSNGQYWDIDVGGLTLRNAPGTDNLYPSIGSQRGQGADVHDGILKNLRVRPGVGDGGVNPARGIEFRCGHHLKFHNLSASWLSDELLGIKIDQHPTQSPDDELHDIEVAYCWFHTVYTGYNHSTAVLINGQDAENEDPPRVGAPNVHNILFWNNILGPGSTHRLPSVGTLHTVVANNMIADYQARAMIAVESAEADFRNNFVRAHSGSGLNDPAQYRSREDWQVAAGAPPPSVYVDGNYFEYYDGTPLTFQMRYYDIEALEFTADNPVNRSTPLNTLTLLDATDVPAHLIANAGARDGVTGLDNVDTNMLDLLNNPAANGYFAADYSEVREGFTDGWPN